MASTATTNHHEEETAAASSSSSHVLAPLLSKLDNTWISELTEESPEDLEKSLSFVQRARGTEDEERRLKNQSMRPVFHGHYVRVEPTPLRNPRLVAYSADLAAELGFTDKMVQSEAFAQFFSGNVSAAGGEDDDDDDVVATWATPYALSIMGTPYTSNCPFGTGDGYGDGRAISIAEMTLGPSQQQQQHYEFQLKGAGPTPWCRGADGRAVLRSSIREFLASEAMHHLGIATTRALSLVVSTDPDRDTSQRPWYSDSNKRRTPRLDDKRLHDYSDDQKEALLARIRAQQRSDPDVLVQETNAITCRVATSFVRIGHLDLFARRVVKEGLQQEQDSPSKYDTTSAAWKQYEEMIWHAARREFYEQAYAPHFEKGEIVQAATALLKESAKGIAAMVAGWVRVGFTQGNFNGDNCLIAGRTMDYGPFGWVDEYHPLFAKWTGSGDHFGFMNQPTAGYANFAVLVKALEPLMEVHQAEPLLRVILEEAREEFQAQLDRTFRVKLGFHSQDGSAADQLWQELEPLLQTSRVDWTLFWRQLSRILVEYPVAASAAGEPETETATPTDADMLRILEGGGKEDSPTSPFYEPLQNEERRGKFLSFLSQWRRALVESYGPRGASTAALRFGGGGGNAHLSLPAQVMLRANPKYVLREYMLVDAYNLANQGKFEGVQELLDLMQHPYDEGTPEQEAKFYRRTSDEALQAGGTAYMS